MNWNNDSMSCNRARESIADSIIGRVTLADAPAVEAHLAGCGACRAYRAECETMWASLGDLPVPAPAPGARARFDSVLRGERAAPSRTSHAWMRRSLIAAGLVGAMAVGYGAARWNAAPVVDTSVESSQQYLLLLYDNQATGNLSRTQLDGIIAEYSAWARGLREAGKLVSAEKLKDEPSTWYGGEVSIIGGDRLGGFFLIRVHDAAEAKQIAAACPHLRHGGRVELRAIQKT